MYFFNVVLGLSQIFLIGYILISEVENKSPVAFLWATLFIMFGLPHSVTALLGDVDYASNVIMQASIFVCGFCLIYMLCRMKKRVPFVKLIAESKFEIEPSKINNSLFEYICLTIFVVSIVGYIINIIHSQGGIFNTSWGGGREIHTSYVSILGIANRLIFTFSGLSFFYFLTKRKGRALIVLSLFALLVLITRNRVQVLPILIFVISLVLIRINRLRVKYVIIGVVLAAGIIYIVYALRAFRYLGSLSDAFSNFSWEYINETILNFLKSNNGELGLRRGFYYFIQENNNFEGFNKGYTYIRMLLVYLPSQWSIGMKPQSFDLYMGQAMGMISGGSAHPTLFGDCFGNLYWFGILLGGFWAFLANFIDKLICFQKENFFKIMIFFLASYFFVVSGRGSVYNGFETFAWGVLFLYLFKKISPNLIRTHLKFINVIVR